MTFLEKCKQENPQKDTNIIIRDYCPTNFGLEDHSPCVEMDSNCVRCWNRKIPDEPQEQPCTIGAGAPPKCTDTPTQPQILDSGNRREFETGAVRDMQEGKGRCDLLPLDVVANWVPDINAGEIFLDLSMFIESGDVILLIGILQKLACDSYTAILDLAKHFEAGAKKYGERNWEKGIPVRCYIDSAVRHYLKYLRGDQDEPHDRAFVWNIVCAIWTCKHKPELNEYERKERDDAASC